MFFETKNLCFLYYRSAMTLKDVSFSVEKNSKTLVLASKDMGKTTLLKVLSGFEDSRFGNIYLNGKELKQISDKDKNFSLVLSEPVLFEKKSIKENFEFQCELCGKEKLSDKRITELLNDFNIKSELNTKVKKLSLFEKRKLQIARTVIKQPQILFLDDQFENLSDDEKIQMIKIYEKLLNDKKLTIIYAVGNETFKFLLNNEFKFDANKVLYLNFAKVTEFKSIHKFVNSYITLDALNFLENAETEKCYIEKDASSFWLCMGEEKLFKFDGMFSDKLEELKLEYGDIEECEVLILGGLKLREFDSAEFNKGLKEKSVFVYSKLTGNLII